MISTNLDFDKLNCSLNSHLANEKQCPPTSNVFVIVSIQLNETT